MNAHHGEIASDFAAHFPEFDPYEVLLNPSPAMVRKFMSRMRRLELKHDSEYYAPLRKAADKRWRDHVDAAKAAPDFDEDLWNIEVAKSMEEARVKNPLEFFEYTPMDRRLDDLSNDIRLLRHRVEQIGAGKEADKLPPFRAVQRPGMPIKVHTEDDSVLDLDDNEDAFAAALS